MTNRFLSRSVGDWTVDINWDVNGADTEKVGTIDEVHPHFLVVGKGRLFHREYYVPVSAITSVEHECVYLNVSTSEIEEHGWDQIPDLAGSDAALFEPSASTGTGTVAAG